MTTLFNRVYVIVFCIIICIPLSNAVLTVIPLDRIVDERVQLEGEKRALTKWPEFTLLREDFKKYAAQVNKYFEDNLSFRKELLSFAIDARYSLLGMESDNEAVFGEQGWLFIEPGVKNAVGLTKVSDEQLIQWADNALLMKQRVEKNGGVFLVMIPPDKAQLYPEYLNQQLGYNEEGRLLNRLKPLLEQRNVAVLDLLDDLRVLKEQSPMPLLYSKTDTHWTHKGALLGYQTTIASLNSAGLSLPTASESQFRKLDKQGFSGDLAGLLGLTQKFTEPLELILAKQSFKVFSPDKTLLVFGDSFSGRLLEFWRYSFKEFECFHHDIGRPNIDLIDQKKADVVVFQMVERILEYPLVLGSEVVKNCY